MTQGSTGPEAQGGLPQVRVHKNVMGYSLAPSEAAVARGRLSSRLGLRRRGAAPPPDAASLVESQA
ncbi:MAG TPA: hypothetical protein VIL08_06980, partial [Limnochorda sp.]